MGKVLVLYDSDSGNTAKMTGMITDFLANSGP